MYTSQNYFIIIFFCVCFVTDFTVYSSYSNVIAEHDVHPHVGTGLALNSRYTEYFVGGHLRIVETSIPINMVINVYGNGRGGKYICKLTHANVWITKMEM